jgi:hypothetical protein
MTKEIQCIYFYVCQSTHVMLCIRVCLLCPAWSNVFSSKKEERMSCHNCGRACVCMCILSVVFSPISPLETVDRFHESWYKLLSLLVTQISYFIISYNLIKAIQRMNVSGAGNCRDTLPAGFLNYCNGSGYSDSAKLA